MAIAMPESERETWGEEVVLNERIGAQTRWPAGVLALAGTIVTILITSAQFSP